MFLSVKVYLLKSNSRWNTAVETGFGVSQLNGGEKKIGGQKINPIYHGVVLSENALYQFGVRYLEENRYVPAGNITRVQMFGEMWNNTDYVMLLFTFAGSFFFLQSNVFVFFFTIKTQMNSKHFSRTLSLLQYCLKSGVDIHNLNYHIRVKNKLSNRSFWLLAECRLSTGARNYCTRAKAC